MTETEKAAAAKNDAEKAEAEKRRAAAEREKTESAKTAGAAEGARSVGEAVKRVADAAVAEIQKVKAGAVQDFTFAGTPGGTFTIVGTGFGASGTVLLGGKQLDTTAWGANRIEGKMPADAKSGEVVVWIDPETQRRARFETP